jgi:hypothetical protein
LLWSRSEKRPSLRNAMSLRSSKVHFVLRAWRLRRSGSVW